MNAERQNLEDEIKVGVKEGLSYPRARSRAVRRILGENTAALIESPNNILAIEYLKYIKSSRPLAVKRVGAGYHDTSGQGGIASATAVRKLLKEGGDISHIVPEISLEILEKHKDHFADNEMLAHLIVQTILQMSSNDLNSVFGAEEGLGSIMKNRVRFWKTYEDIVNDLKSKRYTRTRIERVLVHTLLGVKREDVLNAEKYIRVLAFDEKGSSYLKNIKKSGKCSLPIITNINREVPIFPKIIQTFKKDILAADIYNLAAGLDLYQNSEYVKKPSAVKTRP